MASTIPESVLSEVLAAHRDLIVSDDVSFVLESALGRIGRAAEVDRVYVFQIERVSDTEAHASHRFEWVSPRVPPQIDNPVLQGLPLRASGYGRWLDCLESSVPIVGPIEDFPADEIPILEDQGILSILVLPIFTGPRLWGFIGFDDCTEGRSWSHAEVDILITVSLGVGIALSGEEESPLESEVEIYLNAANRLLQVHSVTFSETPIETMMRRTQVRVRVLAVSYRFFTALHVPDRIDSNAFLRALQPLFEDIRGGGPGDRKAANWCIRVDSDAVALDMERALDVAVLLGEVLANVVDHFGTTPAGTTVTLAIRPVEDRVELAVTARDRSGLPVGDGQVLDGMARALFRHVQERLHAQIIPSRSRGVLFRVLLPRGKARFDAGTPAD